MDNLEKIKKLEGLAGQLDKIEKELEEELNDSEFYDMVDSNATVKTYIKLSIKRLRNNAKSK